MHRVIGERSLSETDVSPDHASELLADMVLARVFDERAVALQRRGWMSGYPPFEGQEASQVGAAHALAADDWLFPTYRANAMQLARGRPATDILRFRRGYSEFERGRSENTFTQATPIATHLPHAVGAGMAANFREEDHAVCAYFGEGATSEGDFHEAMNFAGVFESPVVFFCENNHWAISTPADRQTASDSFAGKADAYGLESVQADGMDPLAVYEAVGQARSAATAGEPMLVESLTYRHGAHSTSDDPDRYRDEVALPDWRTGDPLERYANFLREAGVIDDDASCREPASDDVTSGDGPEPDDGFVAVARKTARERIDEAVEAVEAEPQPDTLDVFTDAYESLPPRLEKQRRTVETAHKRRAGDKTGD